MLDYYGAIDIGASGGRFLLGRLENGAVILEEMHRFSNTVIRRKGYLCWDTEALLEGIITGLRLCGEKGKKPLSVGVDTWGVDFALLDKDGNRLGECVSYRDSRTEGYDRILDEIMPPRELYARTGIASLSFNTVYQLMALKNKEPEWLDKACHMLLMPEYLHFLLTGVIKHEYTNATTTGLVNARSRNWDDEIIGSAGLPRGIFGELSQPGEYVGTLSPHIQHQIGYDCPVVLPCTHDTASAVYAAQVDNETLYLSSGTWSLLGAELNEPVLTEESRAAGLTNEGGYKGTYRFLKNIMGLWVVQSIRKELNEAYSYPELADMAEKCAYFPSRVDINDKRFLAPEHMAEEIKGYIKQTGQEMPSCTGELIYCVYASLAESYAETVEQIEGLTNKKYKALCIVGGGSRDDFLNKLTEQATGKRIIKGPAEATALGNIMVQMKNM